MRGVEAALVDAVGEDAGELDIGRGNPEAVEERAARGKDAAPAGDNPVLHLEIGTDVQLEHDRPAGLGGNLAPLENDEVRALLEPLHDAPADEVLVLLEQFAESSRKHLARDDAIDIVLDVLRKFRVRVRDAISQAVALERGKDPA